MPGWRHHIGRDGVSRSQGLVVVEVRRQRTSAQIHETLDGPLSDMSNRLTPETMAIQITKVLALRSSTEAMLHLIEDKHWGSLGADAVVIRTPRSGLQGSWSQTLEALLARPDSVRFYFAAMTSEGYAGSSQRLRRYRMPRCRSISLMVASHIHHWLAMDRWLEGPNQRRPAPCGKADVRGMEMTSPEIQNISCDMAQRGMSVCISLPGAHVLSAVGGNNVPSDESFS